MRLHGVGRRYGATGPWVVRDVDLTLPERSPLRVEGANGSGKSTLLRLLAGVEAPSAGRITGRPRTAYVPERFPAALPMTALGYLTHLGRVHGLGRAAAVREGHRWLDRFGAGRYARTPMSELSKGSSQKVAVSQALLADPELLVLDEAWTGLDRSARDVLDEAVAERVADGGTVVFVDHDPRRLPHAPSFRLAVRSVLSASTAASAAPVASAPPARGGAARRVRIEAVQPPEGAAAGPALPPRTTRRPADGGGLVLTTPGAGSDALLRDLLRAGWHIRAVQDAGPDPVPAWGAPKERADGPEAEPPTQRRRGNGRGAGGRRGDEQKEWNR